MAPVIITTLREDEGLIDPMVIVATSESEQFADI